MESLTDASLWTNCKTTNRRNLTTKTGPSIQALPANCSVPGKARRDRVAEAFPPDLDEMEVGGMQAR